MANLTNQTQLSEMEADIIGEVMNISMGAAATAMSTILDKKVSITTPRVETSRIEDYNYSHLEPVLGVLIKYIEGIGGFNMLLLKVDDFKNILSHLLSVDHSELDEFDEISMSAICEIMNQMMGSAASALASFLGTKINISPPEVLDTADSSKIRGQFTSEGGYIVSIRFDINIEGLVNSEFVSIMELHLAKEISAMSLGENQVIHEQEQPVKGEGHMVSNPIPVAAEPAPKEQVQAVPYTYPELAPENPPEPKPSEGNLDLIMSVPVQITVELGKTKRKIKDIAEFAPGNIVELDRQAGDQVDIVANGRLIARGDVVVVDDNYSVRITEIMKAMDNLTNTK
ncbi:MAG: flagellar motor switch phosphatase FliY [Anaerovoracaceae bacterium]